jgi:hypothetical protein
MNEYTTTITIKAVQWKGDNLDEVKKFCAEIKYFDVWVTDGYLLIESFYVAQQSEYIIILPWEQKVIVVKEDDFIRDYKKATALCNRCGAEYRKSAGGLDRMVCELESGGRIRWRIIKCEVCGE